MKILNTNRKEPSKVLTAGIAGLCMAVSLSMGTGITGFAEDQTEEAPETEVTETDAFTQKSESMLADFAGALYAQKNSDTCVTVNKQMLGESSYLLTHLVLRDPGEQLTAIHAEDQTQEEMLTVRDVCDEENAVLGTDAGVAENENESLIGVSIKDGEIAKDGATTGNEICLTKDGTIYSPEAGLSGSQLLEADVKETWATTGSILIGDGIQEMDFPDADKKNATVWAMTEPGEYYILTPIDGLSLREMSDILANYGCYYARTVGEDKNASLSLEGKELAAPEETGSIPEFLCVKTQMEKESIPIVIQSSSEGTQEETQETGNSTEEETMSEEETENEEESVSEEESVNEEETISEEETAIEEETISEEETMNEETIVIK